MELKLKISQAILMLTVFCTMQNAHAKPLAVGDEIAMSELSSLRATSGSQNTVVANGENKSEGKDVILYFWATWCPECKGKLSTEFAQNSVYENFAVGLVATDKDLEKIEHFKNKNEVPQFVLVDEGKSLQTKLGVFSVPTILRLRKVQDRYKIVHRQDGGDIRSILQVSNPKEKL